MNEQIKQQEIEMAYRVLDKYGVKLGEPSFVESAFELYLYVNNPREYYHQKFGTSNCKYDVWYKFYYEDDCRCVHVDENDNRCDHYVRRCGPMHFGGGLCDEHLPKGFMSIDIKD